MHATLRLSSRSCLHLARSQVFGRITGMFDFIRSHRRFMLVLLLVLILPSFVFFGLEGYMRMGDSGEDVGTVGGVKITRQEFDNAQREQIQRMQQMFDGKVDVSMFDTPEIRGQTLEGLVGQRALAWEVARLNLMTSDERLQGVIAAIPAVQENGVFSNERYRTLLSAQGMTPPIFEARVRYDMTTQQLSQVMQQTSFVPKAVATRLFNIVEQQREAAVQVFRPAEFSAKVEATPDALRKYYDSNARDFEAPQQLRIEYLVLGPDAMGAAAEVSADSIRQYYEQNQSRFGTGEQRRAAHILIQAAKETPKADRDKARARAVEVLAKVKSAPKDFAALAKQYSEDAGSASNGGDMGFSSRGAFLPAFEEAVFRLKPDEISDLVETEFGFHIIQLNGIRQASVRPLADVSEQIRGELRTQALTKRFAELAESFTNMVYDQSDSLKPAADRLKLTIQSADNVTRAPGPGADNKAPYNNPKVLTALFSDDVLRNKRNTEAIEIATNTLVSARVVEDRPAARRPFEEVADTVRARFVEAEARKLAREAGEARLAALRGGAAASGFSETTLVSRTSKPEELPPEGLTAIFRANTASLPSYIGQALNSGEYAVFRITRVVQPVVANNQQRTGMIDNLARQLGEVEFNAYLRDLKARAKVKLTPNYQAMITASEKSLSETKK